MHTLGEITRAKRNLRQLFLHPRAANNEEPDNKAWITSLFLGRCETQCKWQERRSSPARDPAEAEMKKATSKQENMTRPFTITDTWANAYHPYTSWSNNVNYDTNTYLRSYLHSFIRTIVRPHVRTYRNKNTFKICKCKYPTLFKYAFIWVNIVWQLYGTLTQDSRAKKSKMSTMYETDRPSFLI